ncbi:hypothetical protein BCU68_04200 [Vibrio sp. 10N.286.49.B3]|uniref:hypothetical protein n=1 Tax=Vibrio sp. 10N.286.49.B3 TaxID=1880855 RepID=UPI000CBE0474|nr:hypothetical protein [Vibrio sp. 10N.286.49.B3]PMH43197.1 hypothetical protein BCU68_04200 [Vibrio sp. 10N.286.49.B3]
MMTTIKPDRQTAMTNIISAVRAEFPFDAPEAQICGDTCVGCPKKLIEMVESEVIYWEHQLSIGVLPNMTELRQFGKLCKNIRRSLIRNELIKP